MQANFALLHRASNSLHCSAIVCSPPSLFFSYACFFFLLSQNGWLLKLYWYLLILILLYAFAMFDSLSNVKTHTKLYYFFVKPIKMIETEFYSKRSYFRWGPNYPSQSSSIVSLFSSTPPGVRLGLRLWPSLLNTRWSSQGSRTRRRRHPTYTHFSRKLGAQD